MRQEEEQQDALGSVINRLVSLVVVLLILVVVLALALLHYMPAYHEEPPLVYESARPAEPATPSDTTAYWHAPDTATLSPDAAYGKKLISQTAYYFGPKGTVSQQATNGMNCQNCHLAAGTAVFGINYSAVAATYPKYRARSGGLENIYKRVNDCFQRSLNGQPLDTNSKEMQGIASYIKWLGQGIAKGTTPAGAGLKQLAYLDRAASPAAGNQVFDEKCASCHQPDGQGKMNEERSAYIYPPLWGANSYNDAAGLYRLSVFARFVKYNMPQGVTHDKTQLSDAEAWDVAAYVNSQPRAHKAFKQDWPQVYEKPFDHPFGPYADGFSEEQHKYGPFEPVIKKLASLKKQKTGI